MTRESRRTAAILGAAATLFAAAVLLDRGRGTDIASGAGPSTRPTIGQRPIEAGTGRRPAAECAEVEGASSRTSADLGRGRFGGALSHRVLLRGTGGQVYAALDLGVDPAAAAARQSLNLALVIDRSGSMAGDKLSHAKSAALGLIDRLDERDRVALIQYDDTAQVLVPSVALDREGANRLRGAIRELTVGGSTNLHGGMILGRDQVEQHLGEGRVSRVILLSDGLANAGEVNPGAISGAARLAADKGIRITTVGVGLDYNEDLMEAIAESGRGHYYYVRDTAGLEQVLAGELSAAQATVATNVELRLSAPCAGVEIAQVFGYESRRDGDATVLPLADLFGGDSRKLVVELRVPDRLTGAIGALAAELRYRDTATGTQKSIPLALGLELTDDAQAASAAVDVDVMAQVLKVKAATAVREAAQAYGRGDAVGATRLLEAKRLELDKQVRAYNIPAAAAAPATSSVADFAAEAGRFDPGSAEGKDLAKRRKAGARDMVKGK